MAVFLVLPTTMIWLALADEQADVAARGWLCLPQINQDILGGRTY